MSRSPSKPSADPRRGLAYVAVLVLVLLVTTMGLAFLLKVGAGTTATMSRGENMQAHYTRCQEK